MNNIYIVEKPIIYEYSRVTYKSVNYGNCMENTILQFLKIIFWNSEDKTYNLDIINKITNDKSKELINIFTKIDNEKQTKFDIDWIDFIMTLPEKNKFLFGKYI
jgi:hypothetical protein